MTNLVLKLDYWWKGQLWPLVDLPSQLPILAASPPPALLPPMPQETSDFADLCEDSLQRKRKRKKKLIEAGSETCSSSLCGF